MARRRKWRPIPEGLPQQPRFAKMSVAAKLVHLTLRSVTDSHGRYMADPWLLQGMAFRDLDEARIQEALEENVDHGWIDLYVVDGHQFMQFTDHDDMCEPGYVRVRGEPQFPGPEDAVGGTPALPPEDSGGAGTRSGKAAEARRYDHEDDGDGDGGAGARSENAAGTRRGELLRTKSGYSPDFDPPKGKERKGEEKETRDASPPPRSSPGLGGGAEPGLLGLDAGTSRTGPEDAVGGTPALPPEDSGGAGTRSGKAAEARRYDHEDDGDGDGGAGARSENAAGTRRGELLRTKSGYSPDFDPPKGKERKGEEKETRDASPPPRSSPGLGGGAEPGLLGLDAGTSRTGPEEKVFACWVEAFDHPRMSLTADRRTKIKARLRKWSADELCRAVLGYAADPWRRESIERHELSVLLRTDSRVEAGIERANKHGLPSGAGGARVAASDPLIARAEEESRRRAEGRGR